MYRQSKKNLLSINTSSTCPHNMANFGPLTADIGLPVCGTPANFNSFAYWQRYCSDVAHQRPTKLCTMFGHHLGCYAIYTFWGLLPPDGILPGSKFTLVQVLSSPTLAALLHGTPAAGVSQTLRRSTRNGITELLQRAPAIFGRAAITLGTGPHSSYLYAIQFSK